MKLAARDAQRLAGMGAALEALAASLQQHWLDAGNAAAAKAGGGDPFYKAKLATARFYFAKLVPEVETAMITAKAGLKPLMEMDEALF